MRVRSYFIPIFSLLFFFTMFLVVPVQATASIVINEIAWMGTSVSANAEWVELYNDSAESVSLEGWVLRSQDDTPNITLVGSVSPYGYFLLERSGDSAALPLADQIYAGALGNTGEHLVLSDSSGVMVDEIDANEGWQEGDNTSKETMQRVASGQWVTAAPTPKAVNATENSHSDNSNNQNPNTSGSENNVDEEPSIQQGTARTEKQVVIEKILPDPRYEYAIITPKNITSGVEARFRGFVTKDDEKQFKGYYVWNFGDGNIDKQKRINNDQLTLTHAYEYPGDYVLVFEYYSNFFPDQDPIVSERVIVHVAESTIDLMPHDGGGVMLKNSGQSDINIGNWWIESDTHIFTIPEKTIILKGKDIVFSEKVLGFSTKFIITGPASIVLRQPNGLLVSEYMFEFEPTVFQDPETSISNNNNKLVPEISKESHEGNSTETKKTLELVTEPILVPEEYVKEISPTTETFYEDSHPSDITKNTQLNPWIAGFISFLLIIILGFFFRKRLIRYVDLLTKSG